MPMQGDSERQGHNLNRSYLYWCRHNLSQKNNGPVIGH
ncbi:hypothetical protein Nmel_007770 [Mimus melanotis]